MWHFVCHPFSVQTCVFLCFFFFFFFFTVSCAPSLSYFLCPQCLISLDFSFFYVSLACAPSFLLSASFVISDTYLINTLFFYYSHNSEKMYTSCWLRIRKHHSREGAEERRKKHWPGEKRSLTGSVMHYEYSVCLARLRGSDKLYPGQWLRSSIVSYRTLKNNFPHTYKVEHAGLRKLIPTFCYHSSHLWRCLPHALISLHRKNKTKQMNHWWRGKREKKKKRD